MPSPRLSRRVRWASAVGAVGGAALFVWAIHAVGIEPVLDGIRRVGFAFGAVLLLGGLRHALRATAWWVCLDSDQRLSMAGAFGAYLAGDALGNVTPFGFLISEPSKIVLVRTRVAPAASISALAVENLFYSGSVLLVLAGGTPALLLRFPVPAPIRLAGALTLAATVGMALALAWIVLARRGLVSGVLTRFTAAPHEVAGRVADIERRIFDFASRAPGKVPPVLALETLYHCAAVAEIWIVLAVVTGTPPTLLTAFVLEYVNRTITIAFQFIPMWLGVDEAGTGLMTSALQLGGAVGVTLALVRKARTLFWTAIGLALLVGHGLSPRRTVREAEVMTAEH